MNLKTRLLLLLWTISTGIPVLAQIPGNLEVAILSDLHILHPSLLQEGSETFEQYIQHDRKLLRQGPTLLQTAVRQLLRQPQRPHLVLIPGDLTKDRERISHQWVADSLLRPLREAGIQVHVVPGNHDINNPHAGSPQRPLRLLAINACRYAENDFERNTSVQIHHPRTTKPSCLSDRTRSCRIPTKSNSKTYRYTDQQLW